MFGNITTIQWTVWYHCCCWPRIQRRFDQVVCSGAMKSKNTVYNVDDLVFAKVRGYPAWPAKVTTVLQGSKPPKYSVFFFGTYEVANVKVEDLLPYSEESHKSMEKLNGKRKKYPEALDEIKNKPDMTPTAPPPPSSASSSKPSTPRQSTPAKSAANSANSTPQSKKRKDLSTPSSVGSSKRLKASDEQEAVLSPPQPQEEVLSRSGRKIKVKRFADDEDTVAKSAASAVSSPSSSPATAAARSRQQKSQASSKSGSLRREVAQKAVDKSDAAVCEPEEPIEGDLPSEKAHSSVKRANDDSKENSAQHDDEDRPMIRLVNESAQVKQQQDDKGQKKLHVRAKCGVLLEVDISDPQRPKTFKSERARIMWDSATTRNTRRLISQLEQGECLPAHLHQPILQRADLSDAQRASVKLMAHRQRVISQKMWHLLEVRLVECDFRVKTNLLLNHQNHSGCIAALKDLLELSLAPLMLKKYPEVVDTVRKCRRYMHSVDIRQLANQCYSKFKELFVVPAGKTFRVYFDEAVSQFRLYTQSMSDEQVALLCRDPLYAKPGDTEGDSTEGSGDETAQSAARDTVAEAQPERADPALTPSVPAPTAADAAHAAADAVAAAPAAAAADAVAAATSAKADTTGADDSESTTAAGNAGVGQKTEASTDDSGRHRSAQENSATDTAVASTLENSEKSDEHAVDEPKHGDTEKGAANGEADTHVDDSVADKEHCQEPMETDVDGEKDATEPDKAPAPSEEQQQQTATAAAVTDDDSAVEEKVATDTTTLTDKSPPPPPSSSSDHSHQPEEAAKQLSVDE